MHSMIRLTSFHLQQAVQTYFKTVVRSIYLGNLRIGFNGADGTSTYLTETDFEKEEE